MTVAKKALSPGEVLDAFGGYNFHGSLDRAEEAKKLDALPVGLAPGARIEKPVKKGSILTWSDVTLDESCTLVRLRRQQDAL